MMCPLPAQPGLQCRGVPVWWDILDGFWSRRLAGEGFLQLMAIEIMEQSELSFPLDRVICVATVEP